jgi:hypothetical protein
MTTSHSLVYLHRWLYNTAMILFKEIAMGDVEDPELYAAVTIMDWEKSEQGKWVMEHATEVPCFRIIPNPETYGFKIQIYGKLREQDEIIYRLKYT